MGVSCVCDAGCGGYRRDRGERPVIRAPEGADAEHLAQAIRAARLAVQ